MRTLELVHLDTLVVGMLIDDIAGGNSQRHAADFGMFFFVVRHCDTMPFRREYRRIVSGLAVKQLCAGNVQARFGFQRGAGHCGGE